MPIIKYLLVFLILIGGISHQIYSQTNPIEICDNAIDDDNDGKIDLNDSDCECAFYEPPSLIPNPSFETQNCCPSDRGHMHCADSWIQASEATTDYINTCGWIGWEDLPIPLPIPDGNGCLGFRNGRFNDTRSDPDWKEYAGACLIEPLKEDVPYRFQFHIGFINSVNSPPLEVTIFGSTNCDNLPFGIGNEKHGCPLNGSGWIKLGSSILVGNNEWKKTEINIYPNRDIHAIAIGPDCGDAMATTSLYYFFDNLVLAPQEAFKFEIKPTPCLGDFSLEVIDISEVNYQWYKDGIALLGENHAKLSQLHGKGEYQVWIDRPDVGCQITSKYLYQGPNIEIKDTVIICQGESYQFDNQSLSITGDYIATFTTPAGCDSIVDLNLIVSNESIDTISLKIFPNEILDIGTYQLNSSGEYTLNLVSKAGCDSTVFLILDYYNVFIPNAFTPNGDGINDIFSIMGGVDLIGISNFQVFNRWGNLIYFSSSLIPNDPFSGWDGMSKGKMMAEGVYVYSVDLLYDDGKVRRVSGSISLLR